MEQVETMNGGVQTTPVSNYQAAGYRIPLGAIARRAAEQLLDGHVAIDRESATETLPQADSDTGPTQATTETTTEQPQQTSERDKPPLANVYIDPKSHTVSFLLDDATANTVIYAVRLFAADAEAHAREARLVSSTLPPDSYGAANRHAIASRHERLAARLRALERNYRHVVQ